MSIFKKIVPSVFILILGFGTEMSVFAQQTDIPKPPSINCPVSLYDQARRVKAYSPQFTAPQAFVDFFTYYKRFASNSESLSGASYYVFKFDTANIAGWRLEYYEQSYELPTFNGANNPTKTYPVFLGPALPSPFMLNRDEVDALNTIYRNNKAPADALIADIWLLRFFEESCHENIDNLNNIPQNPSDLSVTGYGKTRANSQSFNVEFSRDLWTATTPNSFTIEGRITASQNVSPSLLIAYGARQNNLTHLAPLDGILFFNSPMASGDSINLPSLTVPLTSIQSQITDNTIYFAAVDAVNPDLSYTGTEALTLGEDTGLPSVQLPINSTVPAPSVATENGGLMKGICEGRTDPSDLNSPIGCTYNDLVRLFRNFWKFILIIIVPIIAIMTAWIGFNFMKSGAEYREKAKEMLGNMITGVLLIIFAWFIVKTILDFTVGKGSCYSFLGVGKVDDACLEQSN